MGVPVVGRLCVVMSKFYCCAIRGKDDLPARCKISYNFVSESTGLYRN